MPELPEVETVLQTLRPHVEGRTIVRAELRCQRVLRGPNEAWAEELAGQRVARIGRHGKNLVFQLDRGALVIHLGMTGKLLTEGEPGVHTRALFELDHGVLLYDDARRFGRIEYSESLPGRLAELGPDAAAATFEQFWAGLQGRRGRIKSLLLDQSFVRGMGNIYTDEALFRARLHPRAQADRLSRTRAARLHQAMTAILAEAIAERGSSVSDYVDAEGRRGGFQERHQVYGKEGQPCVRCGTPIKRTVVAGRGTHFCPKCQKA